MGSNDLRSQPRISVELPVTISIGSQLTVKGQLKDISSNSAFVKIKNNVYLSVNDEVGVSIQSPDDEDKVLVKGSACISRIVPGEGFALYFTKIDEASSKAIKKLLNIKKASHAFKKHVPLRCCIS